jgi:hypothetical protein
MGQGGSSANRAAAAACETATLQAGTEPLSLRDLTGSYQLYAWDGERLERGTLVDGRLSIRIATREDSTRRCPDGILCKPWQEAGTDVPITQLGTFSVMPVPWVFDSTMSGMDVRANASSRRLEFYLGLSSHDGALLVAERLTRSGMAGTWYAMYAPRNERGAGGKFCAQRVTN